MLKDLTIKRPVLPSPFVDAGEREGEGETETDRGRQRQTGRKASKMGDVHITCDVPALLERMKVR